MKRFLICIVGWMMCQGAYANKDSVGIKVIDQKIFILHKVEKGEGLYAVSRRYNVPVQKIAESNPGAMNGLELNQVLMVPTGRSATAPKPATTVKTNTPSTPVARPVVQNTAAKPAKVHVVEKGETLYRISVNNHVSVSQLSEWNKLMDNHIEIGQELFVEKPSPEDLRLAQATNVTLKPVQDTYVAAVAANIKPGPDGSLTEPAGMAQGNYIDPKYKKEYDTYVARLAEKEKAGKVSRKEVRENGIGGCIDDGSMETGLFLALHRTAPPNTIIKVINPMNHRYIYVKVIARLLNDGEDQNLSIKITQTAAKQLNIKDKNFRLEMEYGMDVIK